MIKDMYETAKIGERIEKEITKMSVKMARLKDIQKDFHDGEVIDIDELYDYD